MEKIMLMLFVLIPCFAHAHTGTDAAVHHGSALAEGFIHPFTGLDHLAAMLLVGIWSVQCFHHQKRGAWLIPAVFAALLLCGGLLGMAGAGLPQVESMIAVSLLVFGLLVACRIRLALPLGTGLVGTFAVFHGLAHGAELPTNAAAAALSGMVGGTLLLHLAGMALGYLVLIRHQHLASIVGLGVAAFGLSLLAA